MAPKIAVAKSALTVLFLCILDVICALYCAAAGRDGGTNAGTNGYYWSSTENSSTNAYNLNFNSSNVNPQNNNNKTNQNSVRCVQ